MNTLNWYGYSGDQQVANVKQLCNKAHRMFAYAWLCVGLGLVGEPFE